MTDAGTGVVSVAFEIVQRLVDAAVDGQQRAVHGELGHDGSQRDVSGACDRDRPRRQSVARGHGEQHHGRQHGADGDARRHRDEREGAGHGRSPTASVNDGSGSGAASVLFEYLRRARGSGALDGQQRAVHRELEHDGSQRDVSGAAIATDLAGNPSLADTATNVTVDNTRPTVTLGGLATNAKVRATVPLTASVDDGTGSGVAVGHVRALQRDVGHPISTDNSAPFTASWNTTGLNGRSTRCARIATDGAGNVSPGGHGHQRHGRQHDSEHPAGAHDELRDGLGNAADHVHARRRIRRSTVPRPASITTTSIAPTPAT